MSGLNLTRRAVDRQLAAIPCPLYEIRLVHGATRRPWHGERLWSADRILDERTIKFLRVRNRDGYDIYLRPYAEEKNAGYILVDLDKAAPSILPAMRTNGHDPSVLIETSPGNLQAWIHASMDPLEPPVATALAKQLAHAYGGDVASADWRHLGRLAGFTNQKRDRCLPSGWAPWVKVVYVRSYSLQVVVARSQSPSSSGLARPVSVGSNPSASSTVVPVPAMTMEQAVKIYKAWMERLRIAERFPHPDWSIVDHWVATGLLSRGVSTTEVWAILQFGSPDFPRRHADPGDYLRRTIARAAFPAHQGALCSLARVRNGV